jgi:phage replication O-like protein O
MDNFTKTPNACFEMMVILTGSEFKLFMHIVRQTIGYGKKSDGISISQFVANTGVSSRQVSVSIEKLKEYKVIIVKRQTLKSGGKSYNRYSLSAKGINTLVQ